MRRIKDVYHKVCSLRKDPIKKDVVLFMNEECECTIGQVGNAFHPTGMLCTLVLPVGTYLLGQEYKNSNKLVVPYTCSRHIWEGNLGSRRVRKLFSINSEDRLDKIDIILFATFDPPDPLLVDDAGHFCIVVLNIKKKRFELLDSLRGRNDPDALRVLFTMTSRIKKLWRQARNSKGESFHPMSIDHFRTEYVNVPKQQNSHDCGFFTLQMLQSYDGNSLVIFSQKDILNIRMTLLYSWLTAGDFNIDLKHVLGVDAGPTLEMEEDNFALFETQSFTPNVHIISDEEIAKHDPSSAKCVAKTRSIVNRLKGNKVKPPRGAKKVDVVPIDDDSDDFVTQLAKNLTANCMHPVQQPSSPGSSDDFELPKGRVSSGKNVILSKKRPSKVSKKLRMDVVKILPYNFPSELKARDIKDLILSKDYQENFGMVPLVQFTSPNDDPLIVDGANMFKLFGRGQQMESEIMDHIISYWKDDPQMNNLFNSGHRILLGPFTIPYLLDFAPFDAKDDDGNIMPRHPFDAKQATRNFKFYVRESENLLDANLIIIPHFKNNHHTPHSVDIFDSRRYARVKGSSRSNHHSDRVEIMRRMVALMKEVYGMAAFNSKNLFQWDVVAERCNYVLTPEQGCNECGFYSLEVARSYDGEKLIKNIKNKDRRVEEWKAEHIFKLLFHPKNEISPGQWPAQLQDLILLLDLRSQPTQ